MMMEPQQIPVLLICCLQGCIFFCERLPELRGIQLFREPCGFFRKAVRQIFCQTGQIPGCSGFLAEIVVQIPEFFCKEGPFIAWSLSQFHIGGKPAVLQKLSDALGSSLPGQDLPGRSKPGGFSSGNVNTLLIKPHADFSAIQFEAIAAVIQFRQTLRNLLSGPAFHIFQRHHHPKMGVISAQDEYPIDLLSGKRKSGGCRFYILRLGESIQLLKETELCVARFRISHA